MTDYGVLAQQLVQKHFSKFGSFRRLCTYRSMPDSVYDVDNSTVTSTPIATQQINVIFDTFTLTPSLAPTRIFDESGILNEDRVVIFPSADLSVEPEIGDEIDDPNNVRWKVIGIDEDPKPAIYQLHVRPMTRLS